MVPRFVKLYLKKLIKIEKYSIYLVEVVTVAIL